MLCRACTPLRASGNTGLECRANDSHLTGLCWGHKGKCVVLALGPLLLCLALVCCHRVRVAAAIAVWLRRWGERWTFRVVCLGEWSLTLSWDQPAAALPFPATGSGAIVFSYNLLLLTLSRFALQVRLWPRIYSPPISVDATGSSLHLGDWKIVSFSESVSCHVGKSPVRGPPARNWGLLPRRWGAFCEADLLPF